MDATCTNRCMNGYIGEWEEKEEGDRDRNSDRLTARRTAATHARGELVLTERIHSSTLPADPGCKQGFQYGGHMKVPRLRILPLML